jgi:ArsR family transcriptional regulator
MPTTAQHERLYQAHADICKTFSNPWRLRIVEALGGGERPVADLVETLGIPKSNVSQHLATMRDKGVVLARRQGGHVFYRLFSPKILEACRLMREVLMERMEEAGTLARAQRRA